MIDLHSGISIFESAKIDLYPIVYPLISWEYSITWRFLGFSIQGELKSINFEWPVSLDYINDTSKILLGLKIYWQTTTEQLVKVIL